MTASPEATVPLFDPHGEVQALRAEIAAALTRVLDGKMYILGPEVTAFENALAASVGAKEAIGVASGTDALALALQGLDIARGDEVITVSHTAGPTVAAIHMTGATPVLVDIEEASYCLDPARLKAALSPRTKAIMAVHLYGCPADIAAMRAAAPAIAIVEDCAQAQGAISQFGPVGSLGDLACFSFYPTKNLGALGDGGAIVTSDDGLATRLRSLRNGGQSDRYHHPEFGVNSRLDELQAAVLRVRLARLPAWTARRRALAARYRAGLAGGPVTVPAEFDAGHVYHLFPILTPHRQSFMAHLKERGIGALIHYPIPICRQPGIATNRRDGCPVADRVCDEVCSLPLHPHLSDDDADRVVAAVRQWQPSSTLSA